ncbi:hypothetical protein BKI52_23205 [marine bacterium AO1-C]|nr:hypothetical protein BKI52_23205 [marine bacterium AO1-C]
MKNLFIEASQFSPQVYFNTKTNEFEISGNSYDKDFYTPVIQWLSQYLLKNKRALRVNICLEQLNSGAFKKLNELLSLLENYHISTKTPVTVNWISNQDNDDTLEYGDDVKEYFEHLPIEVKMAA